MCPDHKTDYFFFYFVCLALRQNHTHKKLQISNYLLISWEHTITWILPPPPQSIPNPDCVCVFFSFVCLALRQNQTHKKLADFQLLAMFKFTGSTSAPPHPRTKSHHLHYPRAHINTEFCLNEWLYVNRHNLRRITFTHDI